MTENDFRWTTALVNEYACKLVMSKPGTGYTIQDFIKEKQSQDKQVGWGIVEMTNGKGTWIREVGPKDNWDMFLSWEGYYINQVRRTSDGEVFSLGDMLSYGAMNIQSGSLATTKEAPILSLNVREDNMVYAEVPDKIFFPITHLHKAKPKPQPSSIDRIEVSTSTINFDKQVLNPYPTDSWKHAAWENGFMEAVNKYIKPTSIEPLINGK